MRGRAERSKIIDADPQALKAEKARRRVLELLDQLQRRTRIFMGKGQAAADLAALSLICRRVKCDFTVIYDAIAAPYHYTFIVNPREFRAKWVEHGYDGIVEEAAAAWLEAGSSMKKAALHYIAAPLPEPAEIEGGDAGVEDA